MLLSLIYYNSCWTQTAITNTLDSPANIQPISSSLELGRLLFSIVALLV
jgi:hypothetical protein